MKASYVVMSYKKKRKEGGKHSSHYESKNETVLVSKVGVALRHTRNFIDLNRAQGRSDLHKHGSDLPPPFQHAKAEVVILSHSASILSGAAAGPRLS